MTATRGICIGMLLSAPAFAQAALGNAFTYQGQLKQDGQPVTNTADFVFTLWDAATTPPGVQIGQTVSVEDVEVVGGLFTVALDFGPDGEDIFTGGSRWLQIAVRAPAGGGGYTTLTPRQELTPAPYALALPGLWTQQREMSPNLIGGYSGNAVTSGAFGATIAGGGQSAYLNVVTDHFGAVGGGWGNHAGSEDGDVYSAQGATIGGGANNHAGAESATVGGGADNQAASAASTVAGGRSNSAVGWSSSVGGGYGNAAWGQWSTIAGGSLSQTADYYATVGGGYGNQAFGSYSVIAGGANNSADGTASVVAGGDSNNADGPNAVVAGGEYNDAAGARSLAAGYRAKALHTGAFVWADSTEADFSSSADGEFAVRAYGGLRVETDPYAGGLRIPPYAGLLAPSIVAGCGSNAVTMGVTGGTVSGGGEPAYPNRVTDDFCVVAGGLSNRAGNDVEPANDTTCAVVGGGSHNIARAEHSTVAGGSVNTAAASGATVGGGLWNYATEAATVGGGNSNSATGSYGAVGGGWLNEASGEYSVVPGGAQNMAQGDYSFAAGWGGIAQHRGAFVWADATMGNFYSNGDYTFNVRASNGIFGITNNSARGAEVDNIGTGDGLRAYSNSSSGSNWAALFGVNYGSASGVYGYSSGGYAGYFAGDVWVQGYTYKSGGGFVIDHPLDPPNKYLYHSFVESPDMKNVYDGVVTLDAIGRAWVQLPEWFGALNRDFRYQLTPIGGAAPDLHIATEIADNRFEIAGGKAGMKVSWQVTGIRQDAQAETSRIPVEVDKPADERGTYLHPEACGQSAELGLTYRHLHAKPAVAVESGGQQTGAERE
ncbi:MAG TPA: hypothetical protein PKK06_12835 [Phycisphaerae bacterium]|nr:hypothetical protein [Phycisphaerae bacterium]HNU45521.1 hypothetical protein [Phycisphaerae bacterium]